MPLKSVTQYEQKTKIFFVSRSPTSEKYVTHFKFIRKYKKGIEANLLLIL